MMVGMRLQGKRILIVEDLLDSRKLLDRVLTIEGADVVHAVNGAEGVCKALSQRFDLVLMDINMPICDGLVATEALRHQGYKQPIIALTAYPEHVSRDKATRAGCDDYLSRPIDIQDLIRSVVHYSDNGNTCGHHFR